MAVYTVTLVQGGEEIIGEPTTTTLTTRTTTTMAGAITETPMTMAAVSTTTRITTFSTMFITLTANSAMAEPSFRRTPESPFAFRQIPAYAGMTAMAGITAMGGNDEGGDSGLRRNDERSDIPQNPPQKRADILALTSAPRPFSPPPAC
ncbi:MAG: hypothetical protein ACR2P4_05015 [Gammaproteobacteria bacterium]